jgi:ubiquitin-protein ligase
MSSKRLKRITNEIKELQESSHILKENGIYVDINDENISTIHAMLIGPEKTPYEKGFYFFKIDYSNDYPMTPPNVKYLTQGVLNNPVSKSAFNVRFNPNLYTCGKVCLSMINTWQGDGWVPTNTVTNVLIAIQALVLNEEPLRNEPGYEKADKKVINDYNNLIEYANIKISVLNMLKTQPLNCDVFKPIMIDYFMKNIDFYRNFVLIKNDLLKNVIVEAPYSMKVTPRYDLLINEITEIEEGIIQDISLNISDINLNSINDQPSEPHGEPPGYKGNDSSNNTII